MATIRIWREESGRLPNQCVVCGELTARVQDLRFRWTTPWVWLFLFCGGLIPLVIGMCLFERSITLKLPLCATDTGHWFWKRTVPVWLCFGSVIGTAIASIIGENCSPGSGAYLFFAGAFTSVVVIACASTVMRGSIRTVKIDDRSVTLAGVSGDFTEALWAAREDEDRELRAARAARRRAALLPPGESEEIDSRLLPGESPRRWSRRLPPAL